MSEVIHASQGYVEKTVRTIAAEEVAKIAANAPQDLDTLKEIAEYIESDKTNAAQMVTKIDNNAKAISEEVERAQDAEEQLANKVKELDTAKADKTSLKAEEERAKGAEESLGKEISKKVDKVEGKGLSTNDYTTEDKEKLGQAYSPDNPPPMPDMEEYALKEEVVRTNLDNDMFEYDQEYGYPINSNLFTFSGYSNNIAQDTVIYGSLGLDGFSIQDYDSTTSHSSMSTINSSGVSMNFNFHSMELGYDVNNTIGIGLGVDGSYDSAGIVVSGDAMSLTGNIDNYTTKIIPGTVETDSVCAGTGLQTPWITGSYDSEYGLFNGVNVIEFSPAAMMAVVDHGIYTTSADAQTVLDMALSYSTGSMSLDYIDCLSGLSFFGNTAEIRWANDDGTEEGYIDLRTLVQMGDSGGGGISYGINTYYWTEELGDYAFSLSYDSDSSTSSIFGYNKVAVQYYDAGFGNYSSAELSAGSLTVNDSSGYWSSVSPSGVGTNGSVQAYDMQASTVRADVDLYVDGGTLYLGLNAETGDSECYLDVDRLKRLLALINET